MLVVVAHLVFLVAWTLLARVLGGVVLARLGLDPADPVERSAIAAVLGVGVAGQLVFGLGLVGWLTPLPAVGGLLFVAGMGLALDSTARRALVDDLGALRGAGPGRVAVALVVAAPIVTLALYPPTGFDAGTYHLPFAEHFVDAKAIVRVDALRFPVFPQLAEMGFVVALLAVGDVGARLTQVVPLVAVAGLLVDWGRRHGRPRVGLWAAAFWLGTPLAVRIATQAYVDVTLAACVALGLVAAERWWREREDRWLAVSAAALGFGLATKYLALFFLGVLGGLVLVRALRTRRWRPLVVSGLALALTAAPWVARLVVETGSPVFPFYASIFGESAWMLPYERHPAPPLPFVERWGERLTFLAVTPWAALFDRQVFGLQAPLSPWLLLLLPIAAPAALLVRGARRDLLPHAALVVAYGVFWTSGAYRDLRFLLPVMPSIALLLAAGLDALADRVARPPVLLVALALLAPAWGYAVLEVVERGPIPTTPEARDAFLDRRVGGHRLLDEARALPGKVYGLHAEHLIYHGHGRLIGDWMGPHRYDLVYAALGSDDPVDGLASVLRSMGAGALLVRLDGVRGRWPLDAPRAERCFERVAEDAHPTGRYALYALRPACGWPDHST